MKLVAMGNRKQQCSWINTDSNAELVSMIDDLRRFCCILPIILTPFAIAHPLDVQPVTPINNTIEYDHSYTPQ